MTVEMEKCFNGIEKFYDPVKPPEIEKYEKSNILIQGLHKRFQHASQNELKSIILMDETGL
jgi:hypothetical protein